MYSESRWISSNLYHFAWWWRHWSQRRFSSSLICFFVLSLVLVFFLLSVHFFLSCWWVFPSRRLPAAMVFMWCFRLDRNERYGIKEYWKKCTVFRLKPLLLGTSNHHYRHHHHHHRHCAVVQDKYFLSTEYNVRMLHYRFDCNIL